MVEQPKRGRGRPRKDGSAPQPNKPEAERAKKQRVERAKVQPEITDRQKRFVEEYLVDGNGSAAAIRAGFSEKGAGVQAQRLLCVAKIVAALKAAQEARAARVNITADDVLRGLLKEAQNGALASSAGARVSAWGLIGKHLGMFVERSMQLGPDGKPVHPGATFILRVE